MAVKLGSSLVITANGDNGFQIKATNGPKTKDRKFVLGEEVEEEGADGTSAKVRKEQNLFFGFVASLSVLLQERDCGTILSMNPQSACS